MDAHIVLLKELSALGKELGYRDADLNKWVTAQMKLAEERAKADQGASLLKAKEDEERAKRYRKAEEQREEKDEKQMRRQCNALERKKREKSDV